MNALAKIIRSQIERDGIITFARFMDLALYHPQHGYYETVANCIGRRGDFFTSVSVGSVFGELLAFQFAKWLQSEPLAGTRAPLQLVEAGAHDGQLAIDILSWLRRYRSALFENLEYWIVEPSASRRALQNKTLREFGTRVQWVATIPRSVDHSKLRSVSGIIFSNELLDAMPVHRLAWNAAQHCWFEWGVSIEAERFVWKQMPVSAEAGRAAPRLPAELASALPDGFTTEVSPLTQQWWTDAARWLRCGRLLAFDYGLSAEEFLLPHRAQGTLRAYWRHHLMAELLAQPGEQDLTAHLDFSALQQAGETAGLKTETVSTQGKFLVQIFEHAKHVRLEFGQWNSERLRQFKTLTHPEHFGQNFRVLVQCKNGEHYRIVRESS
jgi:SAM-dependent MidA family methyltransferase